MFPPSECHKSLRARLCEAEEDEDAQTHLIRRQLGLPLFDLNVDLLKSSELSIGAGADRKRMSSKEALETRGGGSCGGCRRGS